MLRHPPCVGWSFQPWRVCVRNEQFQVGWGSCIWGWWGLVCGLAPFFPLKREIRWVKVELVLEKRCQRVVNIEVVWEKLDRGSSQNLRAMCWKWTEQQKTNRLRFDGLADHFPWHDLISDFCSLVTYYLEMYVMLHGGLWKIEQMHRGNFVLKLAIQFASQLPGNRPIHAGRIFHSMAEYFQNCQKTDSSLHKYIMCCLVCFFPGRIM